MKQAYGRLLEDAPDGCFLVGSQTERRIRARQSQVRAVVFPRPDSVKRLVVIGGQSLGPIGVAPQAFDEPALQRLSSTTIFSAEARGVPQSPKFLAAGITGRGS